jgi:hypothetical protein
MEIAQREESRNNMGRKDMNFTHEYNVIIDGRIKRYPSVTQVLPPVDFHCTPEQLEAARVDGSTNHEMIKQYLDTGTTFGDEYLIEFNRFWHKNLSLFGILLQYETPLISESKGFGGTPDIVCSKCIIDVKRNFGNAKYHALQLAGYNTLVTDNKINKSVKKWYIVWRDKNGLFQIKNVFNDQATIIFLSLVRAWYINDAVKNYFKIA